MAYVQTQEGVVRTERLQDAEPSSHDDGDRGSPDDIREDIYKAVSDLQRRDDNDQAEDRYTGTVLASHGTPAEALPQTQQYLNDAWRNPVAASFSLLDHYKSLPKPALYQKPPEEPKYDHPDEFENIRRAIRWSAQQEEHKQAVAAAKAAAKPAFDAFKQQYGDHTPRMLNRTVDLHREMSDSQNAGDTANRLQLELIGAGMELNRDAAGLAAAGAEAAAFFEKYPKAEKYRDKMARLLMGGDANTLEEAAGIASGLWNPDRQVGHQHENVKDAVKQAGAGKWVKDDTPKRVYTDAEKDVRKAVKLLRSPDE